MFVFIVLLRHFIQRSTKDMPLNTNVHRTEETSKKKKKDKSKSRNRR